MKVAETIGYDQVARVARAAGLNVNIEPTPSIALGSYEVTPLEMAGAYTIFVNNGNRLKTGFIRAIRDQHSDSIFEWHPERKPAIDARVAYLMENMMEEVLRSGTGAGVRSRGFYLPAAGKTGTSHDGWFAGFTSKLICVVWVGFDDNRDIKLEGARSALPIWTEFMKRAHQHPEYRNVHDIHRAERHRDGPDRRRNGRTGDAQLSEGAQRSIYRGNRSRSKPAICTAARARPRLSRVVSPSHSSRPYFNRPPLALGTKPPVARSS